MVSGPVEKPELEASAAPLPPVGEGDVVVLESRNSDVRGLPVRRALPTRGRRTIGPWCFVDHAGPLLLDADRRPDIGPHPHIGLHTVTWMFEGEMLHRDSLGSEQLIRHGELNLMTAGRGVAHSEEATSGDGRTVQLLQLWVAQPSSTRDGPAGFEHHAELPRIGIGQAEVTVFIGSLADTTSPAASEGALVGAELSLRRGGAVIPLRRDFEHGLVVIEGTVEVRGALARPGNLAYLPEGLDEVDVQTSEPALVVLLGGTRFEEQLFMWWNFVARTREEIALAYLDWQEASDRFGTVASPLGRIEAPPPPWLRRS